MVWSRNGTLSLIEHIKSVKVLKLLDGKAVWNVHVYHSLSVQIPGMTATQVQNKWKKLKSRYLKERTETVTPTFRRSATHHHLLLAI